VTRPRSSAGAPARASLPRGRTAVVLIDFQKAAASIARVKLHNAEFRLIVL
jgi:hypothetical protein